MMLRSATHTSRRAGVTGPDCRREFGVLLDIRYGKYCGLTQLPSCHLSLSPDVARKTMPLHLLRGIVIANPPGILRQMLR